MRECSKNLPNTERTRIFSESPVIPGTSEQIPLITKSTSTPALDALYSASTNSSSSNELSFNLINACLPDCLFLISRSIFSSKPGLMLLGATSNRLYEYCGAKPDSWLNNLFKSSPKASSALSTPKSSYILAVFGL